MGGCLTTFLGIVIFLALLGITVRIIFFLLSAVTSIFAFLLVGLGAALALRIAWGVISSLGGAASAAAENAPSILQTLWKKIYRFSGAAPETRVARYLAPYRVEGEAELIGDPEQWALLVMARAAAGGSESLEPLDIHGRTPIQNKLLEAILIKDAFILKVRKKGAVDRGQEVILGCTRAINSLMAMYADMRPLLDSLRNKKATLARIRSKMSRYEEQLLEENDPDVIRGVKGAIKSCLETIELLKENRKRAKLFALKIETATTKLENIMQNSLDSGVAEDESLLAELDVLSEEVIAGKADLKEALAELGSLGIAAGLAEETVAAAQRRVPRPGTLRDHDDDTSEGETHEEEFY